MTVRMHTAILCYQYMHALVYGLGAYESTCTPLATRLVIIILILTSYVFGVYIAAAIIV